MNAAASYPHILIAEDGTVRIGQSRYKIDHLAAEHYHYGWSAEELLRQHPDLRPEEVYAALTYFYDHYDSIVQKLKLDAERVEALRVRQTLSREELLARQQALTWVALSYYMDVHIPVAITEGLRRRNIDVLTSQRTERVKSMTKPCWNGPRR